MQTFLIVTDSQENAKTYVEKIREKNKIDPIDCSFLSFENSLTIEDVRNLQKTIFLKPIKSAEKIIAIVNFQKATLEAQNAMLKILEEPPNNTTIFLTAESTDSLLTTILSRARIVKIDNAKEDISGEKSDLADKIFSTLISGSLEEKLKIAQDLSADKESSLSLIKNMMAIARRKMLQSQSLEDVKFVQKLQEIYELSRTTNINFRFILENALTE